LRAGNFVAALREHFLGRQIAFGAAGKADGQDQEIRTGGLQGESEARENFAGDANENEIAPAQDLVGDVEFLRQLADGLFFGEQEGLVAGAGMMADGGGFVGNLFALESGGRAGLAASCAECFFEGGLTTRQQVGNLPHKHCVHSFGEAAGHDVERPIVAHEHRVDIAAGAVQM
jgi:hypothetical protein